jgi:hypothetical protein
MALDSGSICCRNQLRHQKILKFSPWIVLAEKNRFVPQVGARDDGLRLIQMPAGDAIKTWRGERSFDRRVVQ